MRVAPAVVTAAILALAPGPASALSFTKVTTGPVVNDSSRTGGGSWEDYDGDGDPDLFVACGNLTPEDNRLYRNDGAGFVLIGGPISSDGRNSIGGTWGDWDGDGDPDLHVVGRAFGGNLLYRNDGGDAFAPITGAGPDSATNDANASSWVDIDLDGDLDLHVINFQQANRQWRNDAGAFTEIVTGVQVTQVTASISGVWQDYDLDGDADLYVANGLGQNNRLYRNDGGTFVNATAAALLQHGGSSIGASWGDWSNDGYPDLFVANQLGENNYLYRNAGDGTFERILTGPVVTDGGASTGSAFADADNDGDLDLYVGNDGQDNFLYRNDGGGAWTRVTTGVVATDGGATFGVSWADFDSDGFPDLFAANRLGENDFLYRNDGNGNRWLQVRLAGSGWNTGAIGGRVDVFASIGAAPVLQTREMASQSGYNGRNDPRLMFGLGDATIVDSLSVTWPSGLVEIHRAVAVDQVLTLTEGETVTGASPAPAGPRAILRAAPNPAPGRTTILWQSPRSGAATLRILDVRGRTVRALASGAAGAGSMTWDGRADSGRPVPAGVYFVALETAGGAALTRVTLLR